MALSLSRQTQPPQLSHGDTESWREGERDWKWLDEMLLGSIPRFSVALLYVFIVNFNTGLL